MDETTKLPDVGRILGVELLLEADPQKSRVRLQYTDPKGALCELLMPLLDALYLLNVLDDAVKREHLDHLRRDPKRN